MEDKWNFYTEVNFGDESIQQYHIDTRDFCCIVNSEKSEKNFDFAKSRKHPENFFHTAVEVVDLLTRLFNESGGKVEWRFLSLDGEGKRLTVNWQIKYIRIHRTENGLIVCDGNHYALSKDILSCKVNQEHLSAH